MKLLQELYGEGKISEEKKNQLQSELEKSEKTEEEIILQNKQKKN